MAEFLERNLADDFDPVSYTHLDVYKRQGMLWENSDEPYAEEIAATVMEKLRKGEPVETTIQLQKMCIRDRQDCFEK